jgi:chromosome partitioning protein
MYCFLSKQINYRTHLMKKIFSVSNHKGGVGKTTSTVNIGAALALKNFKVLLIDLDPQANLTQSLGVKNPDYTIYDYLRGTKTIIPIEVKKNLYVIPSTLDLSGAEIELSSEPGREYILKEIIKQIDSSFEYVLIDCPPSLGLLTINALTASHRVIIPLQAEFLPLKGLAKLNEVIQKIKSRLNPELEIGGVFFTQFDTRKVMNRDISQNVKSFFNNKLFETTISNNVALAEAPGEGKDIFLYSKTSKGADDYKKLCDEIIKIEVA